MVDLEHQTRPFDETSARAAMLQAGAAGSLDVTGARLMRLGENALFHLPAEHLVVRVARSVDRLDTVRRELATAAWVAEKGLPAARPSAALEQPLEVEGRVVTFWEFEVELTEREPSATEFGVLLKAFHALGEPPFELPAFDPMHAVTSRLRQAGTEGLATDDEIAVLAERHATLSAALPSLVTHLEPGLIHGDAHTANVLLTAEGPLLIDFEVVCRGPREWDLVPAAVSCEHFDRDDRWYEELVTAYGWDVRRWDGYPLLRDIREITMTTWLMQNVGTSSAVLHEFRSRVASIAEGDHERRWHAF